MKYNVCFHQENYFTTEVRTDSMVIYEVVASFDCPIQAHRDAKKRQLDHDTINYINN